VHSLSQYAGGDPRQLQAYLDPLSTIGGAKKAVYQKKPAAAGWVEHASVMPNVFGGRPKGGAEGPQYMGIGPTSQSVSKPLNKITWDSFSQIAKLTGDVDHEPSTPKSGQAHRDEDESDYGDDIE
jgi:hypothetical protein